MDFEEARPFMEANHQGVISTVQPNGGIQNSIVVCGAYQGDAAFVAVRGNSQKVHNLRRNPNCSLLISADEWRPFIVLEGQARILSPGVTDADELRHALRDVYRAAAGEEHSNWDEYDAAMLTDRRSAIIVVPTHIYGTAL
jgi:PPOX class probable F420-dependent enzyme